MIYNFPKNAGSKISHASPMRSKIEKLEFQESIVCSIISGYATNDPEYFDQFGSTKARKIWEISAVLAEEREYRVPKYTE